MDGFFQSGLKSHYHRTPPQKEAFFKVRCFSFKVFFELRTSAFIGIFHTWQPLRVFVFCTIRQPYCIVTVGLKFVKKIVKIKINISSQKKYEWNIWKLNSFLHTAGHVKSPGQKKLWNQINQFHECFLEHFP